MANGIADDAVIAACLATSAPVVVAPGDGRRHVDAPGDARQRRAPRARLRLPAGRRPGRDRSRRASPASGGWPSSTTIVDAVVEAVGDRPVRQPDAAARPPVDRARPRAGPRGSPRRRHAPAAPRSRSTPSGSSATAAPGRWASRSPRPRVARGARVTLIVGRIEVPVPAGVAVVERRVDRRDARRRRRRRDRRPRGRPGHGRRRRRLPAPPAATTKLDPRRRAHPRARADRGHPRRGRARGRGTSSPAPGDRRVRGRDRLARAGARQAAAEGRRPAGGQRRRRGRAPASAPTPTGSRSSAPTGRATTCRC